MVLRDSSMLIITLGSSIGVLSISALLANGGGRAFEWRKK
jgi:hypothetical protein